MHLEAIFDVMDLYLWLSYRFTDIFPEAAAVRAAQAELDEVIQQGVFQITRLLKNTEANQNAADGDTSYNMRRIVQTKGDKIFALITGQVKLTYFTFRTSLAKYISRTTNRSSYLSRSANARYAK